MEAGEWAQRAREAGAGAGLIVTAGGRTSTVAGVGAAERRWWRG